MLLECDVVRDPTEVFERFNSESVVAIHCIIA